MDFQNIVSYCGLSCTGCPIYWATREQDVEIQKKMRNEIASLCNEEYGLNYTYQDVNDCDGCRSVSGRLFSGCRDCKIRTCAVFKEVETCAHCPDYICDKLDNHYKSDPTGKVWLEIIRSTM